MLGLVAPHDHGEERHPLLPATGHGHPEGRSCDAALGVADLGVSVRLPAKLTLASIDILGQARTARFGHAANLRQLGGQRSAVRSGKTIIVNLPTPRGRLELGVRKSRPRELTIESLKPEDMGLVIRGVVSYASKQRVGNSFTSKG
jgi:hypothetical protein